LSSSNSIFLTDARHDAIQRAAAASQPAGREPFLNAMAHRLRGETTIGDGSLFRVVKDVLALDCYRSTATVAVGGRSPAGAPPSWPLAGARLMCEALCRSNDWLRESAAPCHSRRRFLILHA
jgi:hypothetical protein